MFDYPALPDVRGYEARRSVLRELETYVYGSIEPIDPPSLAPIREISSRISIANDRFPILVATPDSPGPWPVLVGLNFYGLHTLVDDERVPRPFGWTYPNPADRGSHRESYPIDFITSSGWALITAFVGDIEPDDAEISTGLAIAKWSAGLQSMAAAASNDPRFDRSRIIAIGHSRLGKAALLSAAQSRNFSGCIAIQSGCGGAAPSRTLTGETVAQITETFPHWFAPRFASFADDSARLPLDQHWLLACIADRRLMLCNAEHDLWANPLGQHHMLELAAQAFDQTLPQPVLWETVGEKLGHYYRPGVHEVTRADWTAILAWLGNEVS